MSELQPDPAPKPQSKSAVFFKRLLSFVVLWGIIVASLFSGNKTLSDYVFLVILALLAALGLIEFYGIVQRLHIFCFEKLGVIGGILLIVATFIFISGRADGVTLPQQVNDFESCFLVMFVLSLCLRQFLSRTNTKGILAIGTTLFGFMYVPWLLNFIQKINFYGQGVDGHYYLFYFILVTKFSDAGAYAVGSLIGRHKMIPRISPGKTWEGFAGAVVVSMGASVIFAHLAGTHLKGMNLMHAIILGIILSSTAVMGDLIESLFKREAGLKDSGKLLPGIGGILDLLDSLLFNAPLRYLYLRHFLAH